MKHVSIPLSDGLSAFMREQVESGAFPDEGAYIRSLVASDRDRARAEMLRREIQAGLDSGISDRSVEMIFEDAKRRYLEARPQ